MILRVLFFRRDGVAGSQLNGSALASAAGQACPSIARRTATIWSAWERVSPLLMIVPSRQIEQVPSSATRILIEAMMSIQEPERLPIPSKLNRS
ncbi:hypothetical protein [Methylobacterium sp. Leaf123]|uniref:hypothetical protein n=1 Tax=Methylobacterium sp. Leaf123 TaxID=1736264 RepID=UPI001AEBCF6A|nr:hypothetical protein [Methylobacterium sp. Leaf123]